MKLSILLILLSLTGCSSLQTAYQTPPGDVQVAQVIKDNDNFNGQSVRWGGQIIEVKNQAAMSSIEVIQFPLDRYGQPDPTQASQGRFLVVSEDFLDPEVYLTDSMVTFLGTITDKSSKQVDQKTITLPVMSMSDSHRWIDRFSGEEMPYNPRQKARFVGYGYYATGGYTP